MTPNKSERFRHFLFFHSAEGYFIYQEASNLIPFDTNRLESPDIVASEKICVDFWYYMFGSEDRNELRVLIQDSTGEFTAWSRKGNQSSSWIYGAVTHTFPTQRKIKVTYFQNKFICTMSAFTICSLFAGCKMLYMQARNDDQDFLGLYFVIIMPLCFV